MKFSQFLKFDCYSLDFFSKYKKYDVHDDDGSVKDIEDHNQDGAHDIADADNNNNEAEADPHLTVEDFQHEYK